MNKNIQSFLFKAFLYFRRGVYIVLGLVDRSLGRKNHLFILSYHSIAQDNWRFSVNLKDIKKQIAYLAGHYDFVTLEDLSGYMKGKKQFSRPSVILTFDDGYKDVLKIKNFLQKRNITPVLFLLSDTKNPTWKELGTKRPFLNKRDIRSLIKAGWEIGSHSATHANLSKLAKKELEKEIISSKKQLEKVLGIKTHYFAYPRGKYSHDALKTVKKAKYTLGLTMDDGFIIKSSNPLTLPRIGIDRTHSYDEFKATFSPSVVALRKIIKQTPIGRYL